MELGCCKAVVAKGKNASGHGQARVLKHECLWDPTELQQFAGMPPNPTFLAQSSQHQLPSHCVTPQP
jgi:hypothetical protein